MDNFSYETITANLAKTVKPVHQYLGSRAFIVAPIVMIKEGVLAGSRGPILYTNTGVNRNIKRWNMMPLTLGHPKDSQGRDVSGRSPDTFDTYWLGYVFNTKFDRALKAEAWFDLARCDEIAPSLRGLLETGQQIEVSTGLYVESVVQNGEYNGKPYREKLIDYVPDHFAILLNEVGACSIADGCGVLANESTFELATNKCGCGCDGAKATCNGGKALDTPLCIQTLRSAGFTIEESGLKAKSKAYDVTYPNESWTTPMSLAQIESMAQERLSRASVANVRKKPALSFNDIH